ncbi:MAG: exo-alpha-sialidase [Balneolaceae bacterium]|nr:MAG: exo-alpha-sialidase [Balneolaceae bacterium]
MVASSSCTQNDSNPNPFLNDGAELFDTQVLFEGERFPNVVVTTQGTVLAVWGGISENYGTGSLLVRRSEDGGATWLPSITVADTIQWSGGGTIVDENSGDILVFAEVGPLTPEHPSGKLLVYRSSDDGKSWDEQNITIHPDEFGNIPSMHINESGITLQFGEHTGRLIRATRFYGESNQLEHWPEHYTNAIYSDDGGHTWHTSAPFPANGTGEAAIEELSDGTLYYNSRRHLSTDGLNPRMRHTARSYDGGESWKNLSVSDVLPDGSQHRDYGLMAGLVRLPVDGHDILLFSNIESDDGRHNGTVWASFDGGETWPLKRVADAGGFAYSSLAAGRAGSYSEGIIYLLYEDGGHPHSTGKIARFNLTWLLGNEPLNQFTGE